MRTIQTRCCITGGGPAGIMLGYLLARANIPVVVLEKWPDFFRDFRGDTIHPSTMDILHELGLLEKFLKLPHNKTNQLVGHISGKEFLFVDFDYLKYSVHEPYIAFIPQWDFLNFISSEAKVYPDFHLMMETEGVDVIVEDGKIVGVKAKSNSEEFEIRADLTVGADGRHSTIREKLALPAEDLGAPIDVLWFRISRNNDGQTKSLAYMDGGKFLIMLDRDDYWQCASLIEKGSFEKVKEKGLEEFKASIASMVPFIKDAIEEINNWDQIKLLSVTVDRLTTWYKEGVLCIGDSAHAMSPVGGVGINLAIQDAVAAANVLVPAFKNNGPTIQDFKKIQKRRELAVRATQRFQVFAHKRVLEPILKRKGPMEAAFPIRLLRIFPFLRWIPARLIGIGFRPEHIEIEFEK